MEARIARLASHTLAEHKASVGLPYENRKGEKKYAIENPPNKTEFKAILEAVKKGWKGCTERTLAELLTGVSFRDNCAGIEGFGAGQYDAQLAEWGLSTRPVTTPALTSADLEIYDGTWEYGPENH